MHEMVGGVCLTIEKCKTLGEKRINICVFIREEAVNRQFGPYTFLKGTGVK